MPIDSERLTAAVREVLVAIGEDPDRPGLQATPRRTAQGYRELFDGVGRDPLEVLSTFVEPNADGLMLVRDIDFFSSCEHNLVPIRGTAHVGYLPGTSGTVTGVGTIVKVVEVLAHRPQLQERLTAQIADTLVAGLQPRGAIVVIEAEHLCMAMLGVRKPGARVVTSAVRGWFERSPSARAEAMSLVAGRRHE